MNKSTAILLAALGFFAGIAIGFAYAPIKRGINVNVCIGSNNTSCRKGKKKNKDICGTAALAEKSALPQKKGKRKWIGQK